MDSISSTIKEQDQSANSQSEVSVDDSLTLPQPPPPKRPRTSSSVATSSRQLKRVASTGWKNLCRQSKKLIDKTRPHEPSFVCMYWEVTKGGHQIVWEGPSHMRGFAEDQATVERFKQFASRRLSRTEGTLIEGNEEQQQDAVVTLHSSDPEEFRNDQLRKLLPTVVNPERKYDLFSSIWFRRDLSQMLEIKNFYGDSSNKPSWYPLDVPFKSPNHVRGSADTKRLTVAEMRKVLQAFLVNRPDQYHLTIRGAENVGSDESSAAQRRRHADISRNDPRVDVNLEARFSNVQEAIASLSNISDWRSFQSCALRASELLSELFQATRIEPDELSLNLVDKIFPHQMDGFVALKCTPNDEGSLFNAASILLYSTEEYASHLKLGSIVHAVKHVFHYTEMFKNEVCDRATAVQFLSACATDPAVCREMPRGEGVSEVDVLQHLLQSEAQNLSRAHSKIGFIQVLFLAGAISSPVQQHCVDGGHELYTLLLPPCSCYSGEYQTLINIMWARLGSASLGSYNHIVPLLPATTSISIQAPVPRVGSCKEVDEQCLMMPQRQCNIQAFSGTRQVVDWAMCNECYSWYHCSCIGISRLFFARHSQDGAAFVCCKTPTDDTLVVQWPVSVKAHAKSVRIGMADVYTLYPKEGLSDQAIDFFTRTMLPSKRGVCVLSTLTYEGIKNRKDLTPASLKTLHKNVNGDIEIDGKVILCPSKPRGQWHWILVAVNLSKQEAYIFDSLYGINLKPWNLEVVVGLGTYFSAILEKDIKLKEYPIEVTLQLNGTDCGVHVIHNMTVLLENSADLTDPRKISALRQPCDCPNIRKSVLLKVHTLSLKYEGAINKGKQPSGRHTKKSVTMVSVLESRIKQVDNKGLKVVKLEGKGRGVVATSNLSKGDFLCSYSGELLSRKEGKDREQRCASSVGCFLYFFKFQDKQYCIDATREDETLGRLINHSRRGNITPKCTEVHGKPVLYFEAAKNIVAGEELLYDYGDNDRGRVAANPWLKN